MQATFPSERKGVLEIKSMLKFLQSIQALFYQGSLSVGYIKLTNCYCLKKRHESRSVHRLCGKFLCSWVERPTRDQVAPNVPSRTVQPKVKAVLTTSPMVAVHKAASLGVSTALQTLLNSFKCLLVAFSGILDKGCVAP